MGLRVKRYGPQITNAEVGLVGLGVVPARRNRYAALAARSTPATRSPQPRTLSSVVGVGHKRIGRSRGARSTVSRPYHSADARASGIKARGADSPAMPANGGSTARQTGRRRETKMP